jgi:hypothetical protein
MADRTEGTNVVREHGRTTPTALHLRHGIAFEDWLNLGQHILRVSSASCWWLGDWLIYGEHAYRGRYRAALERTPLDYQTLRNYAWVARRFELSRRRDKLSFQHHAEVATLTEADQEVWLQRAERLHWSRNELRRQLAAEGARPRATAGERAVVVKLPIAASREQRWREAAVAAEQDLADWIASAADDAAYAALPAGPQRGLPRAAEDQRPERLKLAGEP